MHGQLLKIFLSRTTGPIPSNLIDSTHGWFFHHSCGLKPMVCDDDPTLAQSNLGIQVCSKWRAMPFFQVEIIETFHYYACIIIKLLTLFKCYEMFFRWWASCFIRTTTCCSCLRRCFFITWCTACGVELVSLNLATTCSIELANPLPFFAPMSRKERGCFGCMD